ncbi:MAG: ABC transporter permease [Methanobacteriota archaeon]|nr:MAG: ABC transporter permease [Euryarchaeota archaeon]
MGKPFRRILARRLFNAFITILLIMSLNFVLFRMVPADPALLMMKRDPQTPMSVYWRNVEIMGLNDSLPEQYVNYMIDTFTLEWGISYTYREDVVDVTKAAVGWTVLLIGTATAFTFIIGVALGKIAAMKRGKASDITISGFGIFFYGMPVFWFALVLLIIFAGWLSWFPSSDRMEPGTHLFPLSFDKIIDVIEHMVLPAATMTIGALAGIILIMRNSLVDVLTEDYIVTAYAKGLSGREVMKRHAGPNARLPIVTTLAMDVAFIFGGAFQVEIVFNYKGIGWYTIQAIWNSDYPMCQFIFLIGGVAVVVANLIADLVLVKLDPRVQIT